MRSAGSGSAAAPLPEVLPLFGTDSRNSVLIFDSSDDWASRLLKESSTFWAHEVSEIPTPCFWTPPFSRDRPIVQLVYRSDGKRPRDGAGLASPLLVQPGLYMWQDPLSSMRDILTTTIRSSELPNLLKRLALYSDWKKILEDGGDISSLPLGIDDALGAGASVNQVSERLLATQLLWPRSNVGARTPKPTCLQTRRS